MNKLFRRPCWSASLAAQSQFVAGHRNGQPRPPRSIVTRDADQKATVVAICEKIACGWNGAHVVDVGWLVAAWGSRCAARLRLPCVAPICKRACRRRRMGRSWTFPARFVTALKQNRAEQRRPSPNDTEQQPPALSSRDWWSTATRGPRIGNSRPLAPGCRAFHPQTSVRECGTVTPPSWMQSCTMLVWFRLYTAIYYLCNFGTLE